MQAAVETAKAAIWTMTEVTEGGRISIQSNGHAVTTATTKSKPKGPSLKQSVQVGGQRQVH